jgi:hypothetical protein
MIRREFIALLGGAAAWPLAASAQQRERVRRVGVLSSLTENDPETQARLAALARGLRDLGWTEGRNLRIEYRGIVGGGIAPPRLLHSATQFHPFSTLPWDDLLEQ